MPRTEEQYEEIKARRKAQILEVALEEFAQNGYHRTSMATIADRCELSKGSLYNYFKGKSHLLESLIEEAMKDGEHVMEILDEEESTAFEKISMACNGAFDMIEQSPEYWRFMIMLSLQEDIIDRVQDKVKKNNKLAILKTEKLLSSLGFSQPKEEAYLLGAMLDGILLHKTSLNKEYPFGKMRAYFFEFLKSRYL